MSEVWPQGLPLLVSLPSYVPPGIRRHFTKKLAIRLRLSVSLQASLHTMSAEHWAHQCNYLYIINRKPSFLVEVLLLLLFQRNQTPCVLVPCTIFSRKSTQFLLAHSEVHERVSFYTLDNNVRKIWDLILCRAGSSPHPPHPRPVPWEFSVFHWPREKK